MPNDNVGIALIKLRRQNQLRQKDLSELSGISPAKIAQYETHRDLPKSDDIEKLCKALNCTASEFLGF